MNLYDKVRSKIAGVGRELKPTSPAEAVDLLNQLPDSEKVKALDYLQSCVALDNQIAN